ncbi:MAG: peptide deformylase [Candidatus Omnitrophica bacterium]|nr:peptide deformylase [Candidatus Omnitrophota bacterium]
MNIRKFPDPILRFQTNKVVSVGDEERKILDEMTKTMYISQGVGIAATQVGIKEQFAVVNVGDGLIKLINPVITSRDGTETQEEGCLSIPGTTVKVRRAKKITVQYMDENGEVRQLRAEGLLARAIQHEIDHLNGKVIIDYLNPIKKALTKRGLRLKSRNT